MYLVSCILVIPVYASIGLNGYYENDVLGVLKGSGGGAWGDVNRLRLKFDYKPNDQATLHLEPRYYFMLKSENLPITGVTDLDHLVWDKYYFKFYSPRISLTAGKQRIAWGSGYIWNPTDVFNPFVLSFTVKEEEETNVEAVRVEVPLGAAGGLDGYMLKDKRGLRAKTNVGLFDLSVSYVDSGEAASQAGLDFSGDAWGAGVRGEAALKRNNVLQYMLGWEYTLDNGIGLNLEYYFNGLGKKDKNSYDWAGLASGSVNQLGMDYLYFGLNKILDEITTVKASVLTNLNDLSFLIYPSYTRNISQNVDLSLESMILGGPDGSEYNPGSTLDPTGFSGSKLGLVRIIYSF